MKFDVVKLNGNEIQNAMRELCLALFVFVRQRRNTYRMKTDKVQVILKITFNIFCHYLSQP